VSTLGSSRLIFVALLVVYVAVGVWTTRRVSATGDEPYYFMAADSLLHGEGFDLTDRYEALTRSSYAPADPISEQEFLRSSAPSRVRGGSYPLHDLATSLIIALPLALGGRGVVVVIIAAAMAAAVALGHRCARALGASPLSASAASLAVGLAAPALTYSGQVFADSLAPLAFALAIAALFRVVPRGAIGVAVALLVLLHLRFWPLALALLAVELAQGPRSWRAFGSLIAPLGAAVAGLALLDLVVYGVPLPHAGFALFFTDRPGAQVTGYTRMPLEGLAGMLVDRSFGLIPAAPLAALVFVGAGRLLRDPRSRLLVALPIPYLLLVSALDWTGGFNPQARYFVVLAPLFVVLTAAALASRPALVLAIPLGVWTLGQSAVYALAPWLRYDSYGIPPLADQAWSRFVRLTPGALFPLFGSDGATLVLAIVWTASLVGLVLAGWWSPGSRAAVMPVSRSRDRMTT